MPATMLQDRKLKSMTLVELMISIGIFLVLVGVSVPMLSKSGREKDFKTSLQRVATVLEEAKNMSLNPENGEAEAYRILRTGGNFALYRVISAAPTAIADETSRISGYTFCGSSSVDFAVGSGKAIPPAQIGIKKDSFSGGVEVNADGQIRILQYSPC